MQVVRYRCKPFFLSLIAGAIGGGLASILGLAGTGNGITVIPGTMLYIGNGQLAQYLLMVAVSFALGLPSLTCLVTRMKKKLLLK